MLELYDLTYRRICFLEDNSLSANANIINTNGIKNIRTNSINIMSEKKINGISTIRFEMPNNNPKIKYLKNENLVKYDGEFYKILNINQLIGEEPITKVECRHLSCTLENLLCPEFKLIGQTATELIKNVLNRVDIILNDDGSVKNTTSHPSGWKVGVVDIDSERRSLENSKEQSIFSNLVKIAGLFEAKLTFHSTTKTVDLISQKIDRNIVIRRRKNLKNLDLHYGNNERVITRLYAFGKNDDNTHQEINIMSVNPTRQSYIEDFSWYIARGYTLEYINSHKEDFLSEAIWRDGNYVEPKSLYNEALKKISKISKPKIKCVVKGVDLSIFPEYFIKSPQIGEVVYIIDEKNNIKIKADVVGIKRNSKDPLDMEIEISNEVEYNSILKQIADSTKNNNLNTNNDGTIKDNRVIVEGKPLYKKVNETKVKFEQTDDKISMAVEEIDKTNAKLEVTANRIRAEVNNEVDNLHSKISITADKIESKVERVDRNLSSWISQEADKISMVVDNRGRINSAEIALAIADNYSAIRMIADKIEIKPRSGIIEFPNGQDIDCRGGDIRIRNSSRNYFRISGDFDFIYGGSILASITSSGIYFRGRRVMLEP
ncbi:hypothetical protein K144316041_p20370 (plasmid) [Clostridium tetani]|uniref:phage tail protein n=1 Tax=Clostridium tetani TaxID=1513 RepID=UPI0029537999|nr:phage tail protein [Clostridium tetani]BDR74198.1 hypothetical protein K144316041_p20370 [Clostridium tetani]